MAEAQNSKAAHYDSNYGNFESDLYAEIRREAFGEDMGQNSWHTDEEQDRFIHHLGLAPGKKLLDVACGAGGPALRISAKTGCAVVGIDIHEQAITAARALAARQGLETRAEFQLIDGAARLPFADGEFDAITCIDAINHLPDRPAVVAEWARVLRKSGRLLFTDPITVTGPLSKDEIEIRSAAGFFLFVPLDYDRRILSECGLSLVVCEDVTENTAQTAERRRQARASREQLLRRIEGDPSYEQQQAFLEVASRIARERRLSRFLYVAEKQ